MPLWTMCRPHNSSATPPIKSRTTIVPIDDLLATRPSIGQHYRSYPSLESGTCGVAAPSTPRVDEAVAIQEVARMTVI
jgi:hypothetical protein